MLNRFPHKSKGQSIDKSLRDSREEFLKLSGEEQLEVLIGIFRSFSTGVDEFKSKHSSFRFLSDPKVSNKIFEWKKLAESDNQKAGEVILVLPSVTGLFINEVDLVSV